MKRALVVVVAVLGCSPPADPIGARPQYGGQPPPPGYAGQQPGYGQQQPPPPMAQGGGTANCGQTLQCYANCNMVESCVAQCDQQATPTASSSGRAAWSCIVQSGCQDNDCVVQRCTVQLQACQADGAVAQQQQPPQQQQPQQQQPVASAGGGSFDLVFTPPPGFVAKSTPGVQHFQRHDQVQPGTDFYGTYDFMLFVFPAAAPSGSLADTMRAQWAANAMPFKPEVQNPIIHRRRLKSGLTIAYDGSPFTAQNGNKAQLTFYVVAAKEKVVPVVLVYWGGFDKDFAAQIEQMFDSATIRGGSAPGTSLYDASDVVGVWSTSSSSIADYVDRGTGNYAGDASTATGEYLDLRRDGTFKRVFIAISGSMRLKEKGSGSWKVADDMLVLDDHGKVSKRRILGFDGADKVQIASSIDGAYAADFYDPRRANYSSDWFKRN